MLATVMPREFKFKPSATASEITFPDPGESMTPDEVRQFYTATYPALLNGTVDGPVIENDRVIFRFRTSIGQKG